MKFSLATLLLLVLLAAVGCAALVNASDIWRQTMVTVSVALVSISTLIAVTDRSRAFGLGFAVAGWIYLLLAFAPVLGLRDDLLMDKAVAWLFKVVHQEEAPVQNVVESIVASTTGRYTFRSGAGPLRLWSVTTGNASNASVKFANFADIGHALWILVVACLGGAMTSLLARGSNKNNT